MISSNEELAAFVVAILIAGITSPILSFALEFAPGLREWWSSQSSGGKRILFALLTFGSAFVFTYLSCTGLPIGGFQCPVATDEWINVVIIGAVAWSAGQAAFVNAVIPLATLQLTRVEEE